MVYCAYHQRRVGVWVLGVAVRVALLGQTAANFGRQWYHSRQHDARDRECEQSDAQSAAEVGFEVRDAAWVGGAHGDDHLWCEEEGEGL